MYLLHVEHEVCDELYTWEVENEHNGVIAN